MPSQSSRKQVNFTASGHVVYAHIQQVTGATGPGFTDGGTWTDVPGLSHVPITFRTWSPYEKVMAQQEFPGVGSRAYMRWRRSANIRSNMRLVFGNHIYRIQEVSNFDEGNTDIIMYLQEWQPTGTVR